MAWFNSDGYVGTARRVGLTMPSPPDSQQAVQWNGYEMRSYLGVPNHGVIDTSLQLNLLQAYAACVTYVDAQIGLLLNELEHLKRFENTIVILCSDHGWHLGEQSAWGKMTNFEIATRVPMIVAGPGLKPGRTQAISELVDLYPTVCALSGVAAPGHLEGESLVPVLQNPGQRSDRVAYSQYQRFTGKYTGRALRTDRYRFVSWTRKKGGEVVHQELYDHSTDPQETRNVIKGSQYGDVVVDLEKQLEQATSKYNP